MPVRRTGGRRRDALTRRRFVAGLFAWHERSERDLLIREAGTPWEVLVAEVMSHQTGIERVGPAWRRFVDTWATPAALARAGTRDLLAAWAGLGYNRRSLSLREAARRIVRDHAGGVPARVADLEALPGIGPYTARAIAATAFGTPVAPLDVNVRRVISRVTGVDTRSAALQVTADALVDRRDPRRWLNAVMDLATIACTRAAPRCDACPLFGVCASRGEAPPADAHVTDAPSAGARRPAPPFPQTNRWLRGRLVALFAAAPEGAWLPLPDLLGTHDREAVVAAAESLGREGFLELLDGRARVRP
jgi:A/G-specific adenine glycosylase